MSRREPKNQASADRAQFEQVGELFDFDPGSHATKLDGFPKYASRQAIAKFLTKYELFQKILHVNGSIVECGVLDGAGTLAWAKLSSILEPANHTRMVIGFDTFKGFTHFSEEDSAATFSDMKHGGLKGSSIEEVFDAVKVYDLNRPISHIPKVGLVEGDLCETAKYYVDTHPHLVVAMLYLDVDLYAPTKAALEAFVPRMPKGAIVVFDELNAALFPGETQAVHEVLGLGNLRIERFSFDSYVSYAVL